MSEKKSIFEQDLSTLISLNGFKRTQPQLLVTKILLGISLAGFLFALVFLLINTIRSNRTDIPPQEGQLLNRISIEKAAQLLQEETVRFNPEGT
jgi:hypothetical protein